MSPSPDMPVAVEPAGAMYSHEGDPMRQRKGGPSLGPMRYCPLAETADTEMPCSKSDWGTIWIVPTARQVDAAMKQIAAARRHLNIAPPTLRHVNSSFAQG